jgi:integrase
MNNRRINHTGLLYRLYERYGIRTYSIGFKQSNGKWAFRYSCPVIDKASILALRSKAINETALLQSNVRPSGVTKELIEAWLKWQNSLPLNNLNRRANSTLSENKREAENLIKAFGHMDPNLIEKEHLYGYLDSCVAANRPSKGNKEISLFQVILEYGIRIGRVSINPANGLRKNKTVVSRRYVTDDEIDLAVEMGRKAGGSRHIVALALKTAWLCLRRSVEIRSVERTAITEAGIIWQDGKSKAKAPILMQWTPELKETIEEVLALKRNNDAGTQFLFGNLSGAVYSKGGWKSILKDLMTDCAAEAKKRGIQFEQFSLQDCRPKGVSDKLETGQTDTQDATGHTNERMIRKVYDRRQLKKATQVK